MPLITNERYDFKCKVGNSDNQTASDWSPCLDRCLFCKWGRGCNWREDFVRCECPIKVKKGDIIQVDKIYRVTKKRKNRGKK